MAEALRAQRADALIIGSGLLALGRTAARLLRSPHHVLHDPDRAVYRSYGLGRRFGIVQRSGSFVVDAGGVLRFVHTTTNPAGALPHRDLMAVVEALNPLR